MDLQRQLKEATKTHHDQIEQTSLLKKIMQQDISLSEYQLLIQKFHGFIKPCEASIDLLAANSFIQNRKKVPWLEQDLQALKISNTDNPPPPSCSNLPVLSQHEHVLGYLYVIEGSTLGAQVITKMLKSQLQLTQDNGGRFFYGYGMETKLMWTQYCSLLSNISDIEQQKIIIHSAKETFKLFHEWLDLPKGVDLNE